MTKVTTERRGTPDQWPDRRPAGAGRFSEHAAGSPHAAATRAFTVCPDPKDCPVPGLVSGVDPAA